MSLWRNLISSENLELHFLNSYLFSYRDSSYNTDARKAVQSYPTSYPRPDPISSSYSKPETSYSKPDSSFSRPESSYNLTNSYSKTDLSSYSRPEYNEASYSKPESSYSKPESSYTKTDLSYSKPELSYSRTDLSYSKPDVSYRGESYTKPDYSLYSERKGSESYTPGTYSSTTPGAYSSTTPGSYSSTRVADGIQDQYKVPTYEDRINSVLRQSFILFTKFIWPKKKKFLPVT